MDNKILNVLYAKIDDYADVEIVHDSNLIKLIIALPFDSAVLALSYANIILDSSHETTFHGYYMKLVYKDSESSSLIIPLG